MHIAKFALTALVMSLAANSAHAYLSCDDHSLEAGPLSGWRMTMISFNSDLPDFPTDSVKLREVSMDNRPVPGFAGQFYLRPLTRMTDIPKLQAALKTFPEVTIQITNKTFFRTTRYRNPMMSHWSVTDHYAVTMKMTAPIEIGTESPDDIRRKTASIEFDTFCSATRSEPAN